MSGFEPEPGSEAWDQYVADLGLDQPGSKAWHLKLRQDRATRPWYAKKRTINPAGLFGLIFLIGMIPAAPPATTDTSASDVSLSSAGLETADRAMSFEECNREIRTIADQFGTPINIVDSAGMRIVRFNATDGSVLVTCSAPEEKMTIVKSPHHG